MALASNLKRLRRTRELLTSRLSVWRWAKIWFRASFLPEQNYLIILAVVVGVLTGFGSVGFIWSEDRFAQWRFPEWLKPAIGGLLIGLVLRFFPEVYGASFDAIESALWVRLPWELLLGLFVAALVANCATLGSGGSGGVFAPRHALFRRPSSPPPPGRRRRPSSSCSR